MLNRTSLWLLPFLAACAVQAPAPPALPDCPPAAEQPALVRVSAAAPEIREEVRYATSDNFTGAPLPGYETPAALLRPAAAEALARVQRDLEARRLGLLVWDAYRPVRATLAMVDWAERSGNEWVLEEGYVARRSNHNRGNTVDLTVVDLRTGAPLDMGTEYDHFGVASHTANASGAVLRNRRILVDAMAAEGWENYAQEWWHFTHPSDDGALDIPIGCYAGRGS
ncbi:MAG: peptidase M15 [Gemmatimonadetes bacterium]|nr:peptidase M15 [Gemmatimonadota bacterium]